MKHYFKRRWEESRGDQHDAWGASWWFFETDDEFWPDRQIEIYDAGQVLFYHRHHLNDIYGGLGECALDSSEFEAFRITQAEFEYEWSTHKPLNELLPDLKLSKD
jgi:hypothetical protein